VYFGSNDNSYINLRSQIHNIVTMAGGKKKKKKIGQQWKQRVQEIFPRAILGTRCIGSSALFQDVII
jgi:hypothetical protein